MDIGAPIVLGGNDSIFFGHAPKAEAIFVGKLVAVGAPPGFFSGYQLATQSLTYEVSQVLKGEVEDSTITVHQLIVARSPVLDGGKPQLAPAFTEIGAEYIVAVGGEREGKRLAYNENMAPVRATPDNLDEIRRALATPQP